MTEKKKKKQIPATITVKVDDLAVADFVTWKANGDEKKND